MSIQGVGASPSIQPIQMPSFDGTQSTQGSSGDFGNSLTDALGSLQNTQGNADNLAMQAATGQLPDISDYMIAANQAEIATQLTVAVRDKALESFNQIMNMQV